MWTEKAYYLVKENRMFLKNVRNNKQIESIKLLVDSFNFFQLYILISHKEQPDIIILSYLRSYDENQGDNCHLSLTSMTA